MTDQERINAFVSQYPASTAYITCGWIFDADLRATSPVMRRLGEQTTIGDVLRVIGIVAATGDTRSNDYWSSERMAKISKDVAGRVMSVEAATMMMAAYMRGLYAYHQDCVDFLSSEVNRLMAQVKKLEAQQEIPQEYKHWCLAAMEVIELGVELMPNEQMAQWTAVRAVHESCPVEWSVK